MTASRSLVILEGPDGGGKSTVSERLVSQGYHRAHSGSYPGVKKNLARLYVEAMQPALLGYADVVMDRAWMSEAVYGEVYRGGADRLGDAGRRMLDRIAARCATRVFLCLPPADACVANWAKRRSDEYLKKEQAVRDVWKGYFDRYVKRTLTDLPCAQLDYTDGKTYAIGAPTIPHSLDSKSAGFLDAPIVVVGESLPDARDADPRYRAPFVAFDRGGCSAWLADRLTAAGVGERHLLWVNADDAALEATICAEPRQLIVALGQEAFDRVDSDAWGCPVAGFEHPQSAKRFHFKRQEYAAVTAIKEAIYP